MEASQEEHPPHQHSAFQFPKTGGYFLHTSSRSTSNPLTCKPQASLTPPEHLEPSHAEWRGSAAWAPITA